MKESYELTVKRDITLASITKRSTDSGGSDGYRAWIMIEGKDRPAVNELAQLGLLETRGRDTSAGFPNDLYARPVAEKEAEEVVKTQPPKAEVAEVKRAHAPIQGKRSDVVRVDPKSVTIIGLDTSDGPEHCLWDRKIKRELDPHKVAQVRLRGVKYPVLLRKNGDRVEVVDGKTRTRWLRKVNEDIEAEGGTEFLKLPTIMFHGTDKEAAALLVELNETREDETWSDKAEKARRLVDKFGFSDEEAAASMAVGIAMFKNYLTLKDLVPEVMAKVDAGHVTVTKAVKIAKTVRRENQAEAAKAAAEAPRAPSRPSRDKVLASAEEAKKVFGKDSLVRIALLWAAGEATDEHLTKAFEKKW